ncbi:MAG TPA: YfiR family protein [Gammaproteobacteria bacterium]|nr:YfiR family protein [Gammaproteobacteria bacterium]
MSHPITQLQASGLMRCMLWLLCAPLLGALLRAEAAPAANPAVEYQVKASLVFNFMHFIEWPADAFGSDGRINICLVGRDVYGNALRVLERELVQGKSIAVQAYPAWSAGLANGCQVIIFSGREREPVEQALAALATSSVLTVGETPGFLEDGGIIKFAIVNDTVQFEVNLEAAKAARLNISSKLLRLANNVVTTPRGAAAP